MGELSLVQGELSHERGSVFCVNLGDFLFPVDVGLVEAVDPTAAHVVAAGADLTLVYPSNSSC